MRPAQRVPETLPDSRLLKQFQATQQHLAMVVDEHGTVTGAVTLENVLEQIVGPLEYEFDSELPDIVRDGPAPQATSERDQWVRRTYRRNQCRDIGASPRRERQSQAWA